MMQESIHVFISYAHEDEFLKNQLLKHLAVLQQQGFITHWHDRDISAGTDWTQEIDTHLNTAHIILLLVSADFLASQYCYSIEMKQALARHQRKEAHVIPIILRPVDWHEAPFNNLQVLPSGGKPVTSWSGTHGRDRAFTSVAQTIRTLVKVLRFQPFSHDRSIPGKESLFDNQKQNTFHQSAQLNSIFSIGQSLTRLEDFYGREYECNWLLNDVRRTSNISLVGPFQIGKTWLLQYLVLATEKELGPQFVIRYMDAHSLRHLTENSFFDHVTMLFGRWSSGMVTQTGADTFAYILEELRDKSLFPILCIDEFDRFTEFDPNFFNFLRALLAKGLLTMVTASKRPLHEIGPPEVKLGSPWFNMFRYMIIGPFNTKEAELFIRSKGMQAGLTEQEQKCLLTFGQMEKDKWYPSHLQLAGKILLEDKNFAAKKDQSYYRPDDPMYWPAFEDRLKKEIFMIEGKSYESPSIEEPELIRQDVKDALDQWDDVEALSGSILAETYYVRSRYENAKNGLSIKKGKIVMSLLYEAHKLMNPDGIRADSAPEWRLYNILYYRYFKHHLTVDKLIDRLGITSRRQFYRELERAVLALLEEILKLEEASYLEWLYDK